ncbi:hypothetical protein NEOLI_003561 [Neolecta irregularis DAH-3]|uniref:Chromatin-remodeling complexes subunit ngg1 n=1 Tax=Neolecta irregularis (strain DAH-3) TaxID=1198029 RepID=A0A1U7LNT0_NEOID|nr:hypothetical protein NEOLI_003561 [Neolecta irregularis DAH-3]|eukprot:OLL24181.1 hypothetical protein NEOLI_003561 [Neolecta irregularis DAH-3]
MITDSSLDSASTPKSIIEQPPQVSVEPSPHSFYKLRPYKERPKPNFDFANSPNPEELKKYLGVSYYPQVDLSKDMPGVPPMEDFSKAKAMNPVAQQTFQASIDPYFRQFTEEDLGWLRDRGDQITPYIVPELGPHYTETWDDEDFLRNSPPPSHSNQARGSIEQLTDEKLETDDIGVGPLTSRILSALLEDDKENGEINPDWRIPNIKADYPQLEERNIDWTHPEDDEISATLRSLQSQLRRVEKINSSHKSSLEAVTRDQMAYQEYSNLLESLEKEIEQSFLKRTRSIKSKKKKPGPGVPRSGVGEGIKCLVERRKRWMATLGPVFRPIEKYTRVPEDGKFTEGEF